jgi:hypothetical protein
METDSQWAYDGSRGDITRVEIRRKTFQQALQVAARERERPPNQLRKASAPGVGCFEASSVVGQATGAETLVVGSKMELDDGRGPR